MLNFSSPQKCVLKILNVQQKLEGFAGSVAGASITTLLFTKQPNLFIYLFAKQEQLASEPRGKVCSGRGEREAQS